MRLTISPSFVKFYKAITGKIPAATLNKNCFEEIIYVYTYLIWQTDILKPEDMAPKDWNEKVLKVLIAS